MRSGKEMSKKLRDAKKQYEHQDEPKDLQDAEIERANETTEELDENIPKEHSDGEDLSNAEEMDQEKSKRMDRVRKMMRK